MATSKKQNDEKADALFKKAGLTLALLRTARRSGELRIHRSLLQAEAVKAAVEDQIATPRLRRAKLALARKKQRQKVSSAGQPKARPARQRLSREKECLCRLTYEGKTREYPGVTKNECASTGSNYGLAWEWKCE